MNDIQRLLIEAEAARVEQFIRRCEREPLYPNNVCPAPILCCELCERRAAPGQLYCVDCLHPENIGERDVNA